MAYSNADPSITQLHLLFLQGKGLYYLINNNWREVQQKNEEEKNKSSSKAQFILQIQQKNLQMQQNITTCERYEKGYSKKVIPISCPHAKYFFHLICHSSYLEEPLER